MREIKFRVWDKGYKTFWTPEKIDLINLKVQIEAGCAWESYDPDGNEEVILMQYTGMKDKNGKEIYEGDIVEWVNNCGDRIKNKVFFEDGAFRVCNPYFAISEYGELQVIGNIYENKELLEVK